MGVAKSELGILISMRSRKVYHFGTYANEVEPTTAPTTVAAELGSASVVAQAS